MREIEQLISITLPYCLRCVRDGAGGLDFFCDPIDGNEVSAHYGMTHAASAFIIWGKIKADMVLYEKGISLLKSILTRWDRIKTLRSFHYDFNNFALSILADIVEPDLSSKIKSIIVSTEDSNHDTINWLPMRWEVNRRRLEWTKDKKYAKRIEHFRCKISKATNLDGGIEDRLPSGKSFNLQYDIATVALLEYLNTQGESIDIQRELGFLLNCVLPDGDINYLGRGTNQVFAWGLWIYLLSASGQDESLGRAIGFLSKRLPDMLNKDSMMLNSWDGREKYLWWDYHFASVYAAHLLLWLVLASRDYHKACTGFVLPLSNETGVNIHKSDSSHIVWFSGRSEYLSEYGPAITSIWTQESGAICKGAFGPWKGLFGNQHCLEDVVLKNYCGLLCVKSNLGFLSSRLISRFFPMRSKASLGLSPVFCPIEIVDINGMTEIRWKCRDSIQCIFNLPFSSLNQKIELECDDRIVPFFCVGTIRNQYETVVLSQSHIVRGKRFTLRFIHG